MLGCVVDFNKQKRPDPFRPISFTYTILKLHYPFGKSNISQFQNIHKPLFDYLDNATHFSSSIYIDLFSTYIKRKTFIVINL